MKIALVCLVGAAAVAVGLVESVPLLVIVLLGLLTSFRLAPAV